ncbi:chloride conductance regulatory protein ICln-like [Vicia villosa]|uniref:chloride conductance regulatory protein ICln-like n=1 Tax=Vicia villosa TaxID=3911 RepID=UPI00273BDC96|nr:chloride conductance regulatory protein ICln-like [Vicia villosa]
MAIGLRSITGEPAIDRENGEEVMRVQPGVDIALANLPRESPGTLYITTKQVIWVSDVDKSKGYAVDFLSISLHAVSRDPEAYSVPCLYTQIETEADEDLNSDNSDSEESTHVHDLSVVREMRLIPSDPTQLDSLFQVFCECAELNPDPNNEEQEEEHHDWIFSADQMEDAGAEDEDYLSHNPTNTLGHSNGHQDLAHNILDLQINDERFEDAEETEHDGDESHHH